VGHGVRWIVARLNLQLDGRATRALVMVWSSVLIHTLLGLLPKEEQWKEEARSRRAGNTGGGSSSRLQAALMQSRARTERLLATGLGACSVEKIELSAGRGTTPNVNSLVTASFCSTSLYVRWPDRPSAILPSVGPIHRPSGNRPILGRYSGTLSALRDLVGSVHQILPVTVCSAFAMALGPHGPPRLSRVFCRNTHHAQSIHQ
jgi:hypothetical protein